MKSCFYKICLGAQKKKKKIEETRREFKKKKMRAQEKPLSSGEDALSTANGKDSSVSHTTELFCSADSSRGHDVSNHKNAPGSLTAVAERQQLQQRRVQRQPSSSSSRRKAQDVSSFSSSRCRHMCRCDGRPSWHGGCGGWRGSARSHAPLHHAVHSRLQLLDGGVAALWSVVWLDCSILAV